MWKKEFRLWTLLKTKKWFRVLNFAENWEMDWGTDNNIYDVPNYNNLAKPIILTNSEDTCRQWSQPHFDLSPIPISHVSQKLDKSTHLMAQCILVIGELKALAKSPPLHIDMDYVIIGLAYYCVGSLTWLGQLMKAWISHVSCVRLPIVLIVSQTGLTFFPIVCFDCIILCSVFCWAPSFWSVIKHMTLFSF